MRLRMAEPVAHHFARGLALCHLDAVLKCNRAAERFMQLELATALAARGIPVRIHDAPHAGI